MKTYLTVTMALGAWASLAAGMNPWQVAASAMVAPVLLPVALAHEVRCYVEEWGAR